MIITTDDLREKINRYDLVQREILEHYRYTRDENDCKKINAMYYQLLNAFDCLEKGLKGEFGWEDET